MLCVVKQKLFVYSWQSISRSFKRLKTLTLPDVCTVIALRDSMAVLGLSDEFCALNIEDARDNSAPELLPVTAGAATVEQVCL